MTWLELRCRTDEPIAGTRDLLISVHIKDETKPAGDPPAIGANLHLRPTVQAVIGLPTADYDRLWALATAGLLKYGRIAFTQPFRNKAAVDSAAFANEQRNSAITLWAQLAPRQKALDAVQTDAI